MAIPFEGQCADAPEVPGRQLDRLAAGEDSFDDVGSQESELDIAPDVARVGLIAPGNLLNGPDVSSPCGQETRPRSRCELGMVRKHPNEASGAWVFGYTPTHRGSGQFVTSTEIDRPR